MFEECLKNAFPDSSNVEKLTLLTKKRSEERFLNKSECLSYFSSVSWKQPATVENTALIQLTYYNAF